MPNWVFNYVSIEGDEESVAKVKAQVSRPFSQPQQDWQTKETTIVNLEPVFAFFNIARPDDEHLDEYYGIHGYADGEKQGDTPNNWYNFNNRVWGTKWDVASGAELTVDTPTKLVYQFDTAWAPPVGVLNILSEQYPTLTIKNDWQEEQGFGSTIIHKDGEEEEFDGYDWMCNDCDYKHNNQVDGELFYDEEEWRNICPKCEPEKHQAAKEQEVTA